MRCAISGQRLCQHRQLQHRAGARHLRVRGHTLVHRFAEMALHRAQLHIGLAADVAHRLGKLIQCRGVDGVYGKRQRHPQHHGAGGGGAAPGVVAQLLQRPGAKQSKHGADCGPGRAVPRRWRWMGECWQGLLMGKNDSCQRLLHKG